VNTTKIKMMIAAALLVAGSIPALSASEKEENVATEAAAVMMLAAEKCNLDTFDIAQVMKKVENTYELTGVRPSDYKPGEWFRKVLFTISQTGYLSEIEQGEPRMLMAFCKGMSENFPKKPPRQDDARGHARQERQASEPR